MHSRVLVAVTEFGSVWRRRFGKNPDDLRRYAKGVYYNTTGIDIATNTLLCAFQPTVLPTLRVQLLLQVVDELHHRWIRRAHVDGTRSNLI